MKEFLFIPFLFIITLSNGQEGENWKISLDYHVTTKSPELQSDIQVNGTVLIEAVREDVFQGTGMMNVNIATHSKSPNGEIDITEKGSGPFTLTGKTLGRYLVITIGGQPFKTLSTAIITTIVDGLPQKTVLTYEGSYSPASFSPADISIDRKSGVYKQDIKADLYNVNGTLTITLAGDNYLTDSETPPTLKSAGEGNPWELNLAHTSLQVIKNDKVEGEIHFKINESIKFPVFKNEDSVEGHGKVSMYIRSEFKKPVPINEDGTGNGTVRMNGVIKNDTLHFILSLIDCTVNTDESAYSVSGRDMLAYMDRMVFAIPFENNSRTEVRDTITGADGYRFEGNSTWTLNGKKIEKWKVIIDEKADSYAIEVFGNRPQRCGFKVHTQRIIEITIENGAFKTGEGSASFISFDQNSYPPNKWKSEILNEEIIGSGLPVEEERYDQVRNAKRFNPPLNETDAALKEQWLKIEKHKTPYIFPEAFIVSGIKKGNSMSLVLPPASGFAIAISCTIPQDETYPPRTGVDRVLLNSRFNIRLIDGWHIVDPQSDFNNKIEITVHRLE